MNSPTLTLLLVCLLAAGCSFGPPPSRSTVAARAACRAQSEDAFNRQNRALLSTRDTTDTPFSTSGTSGVTTAGLSREFGREAMLDDCLRGNRAGPGVGAAGEGAAFQGSSVRTPTLPGE